MQTSDRDTFYQDSPRRLLRRAELHAKDIENSTELQDQNKMLLLKELGERRKDDVRAAIDINRHQNDLFRKLEEEDEARRRSLLSKIEQKVEKCSGHRQDYYRKRSVDMHKTNEKVEKKLDKHHKDERQFAGKCQEQAEVLSKQMIEFHKKQMNALEAEWKRLRNLKTCYAKADHTINHREKEKQDFALRSQKELEEDFKKNCKRENPEVKETIRRRHKRMSEAFKSSNDYYSGRFERFMQTYCSDLDTASEMQSKKEDEFRKTTDRINKSIHKRTEKWSKLRSRVIQEAAVVEERCTNKMNKSLNSSFRLTMTSMDFHKTARTWRTRNDYNKHHLKELQTQRDDKILRKHIDTTLHNQGSSSLNNTMTDIAKHAGFQAREFL